MPTYSWTLLRAATFKLDGGSMFGLIPRTVWSKSVPTDDKGRITVQHNCLLLSQSDNPSRKYLLEVGTGNKMDPKSRAIFDLENRWIGDALAEAHTSPADIRGVVCTHLHFDHAGGLTRLPLPGEDPGPLNAVPTFPNASIVAQAREWEDALANKSVMTRTYFRDHLDPIKHQLTLVNSPYPFDTPDRHYSWAPARDEHISPAVDRMTEVFPGIHVFRVPGHTWGQQAMTFTDDKNRRVVFTPDVMPTLAHVGAAYSLAYDVEPYTSMISRRWFLSEAADHNWLLVLDHEPGNPVCRVKRTDTWFELIPDNP